MYFKYFGVLSLCTLKISASFCRNFKISHDTNNYRSPSSHKKGRITTFQPRYGLCGSVLSTVASLRLEMALVKKAGHLIRLDDCFDRSVGRANYEKVKKIYENLPYFYARSRGFNSKTAVVGCERSRVQFQNDWTNAHGNTFTCPGSGLYGR